MASSRHPSVSALAVKRAQGAHSWSEKPWAGPNILLPPQGFSPWKTECAGCAREERAGLSPCSFQSLALLVK